VLIAWLHNHTYDTVTCVLVPIEPPHYICVFNADTNEIKRVLEPIEDEI
jgi:hypothetical protein